MQELRVESSVDLLVDRARQGDRNAFGDLVRLHQHEVFTLAVRLVADRTVAADVAQDAFIRAWRALPRFRGDAAFAPGCTGSRSTPHGARGAERRPAPFPNSTRRLPSRYRPAPPTRARRRSGRSTPGPGRRHWRTSIGMRAVVVLKDIYGWSHDDVALPRLDVRARGQGEAPSGAPPAQRDARRATPMTARTHLARRALATTSLPGAATAKEHVEAVSPVRPLPPTIGGCSAGWRSSATS